MEQPNNDLSEVMGQLSVTAEDSDKTLTLPKNLSDMPVDVVGLVIERSDYKEQLILRRTSKSLRELVYKQKPSLTRLEVSCKQDCIICYYNEHYVAYVSPTWDEDDSSSKYDHYLLDTIVPKVNYEEVAFEDLTSTLKNPKLQLEYFSFDAEEIEYSFDYSEDSVYLKYDDDRDWDYRYKFENMENILKSINHQLSVKECRINISDLSYVMSILPYVKPGVLEKITIFSENEDRDLIDYSDDDGWSDWSGTMEQVALLDQWKQAKELHIECGFDEEFPVKHVTHFKRFQFDQKFLEPYTLRLIRDFILDHENAEFCSISAFGLLAEDFEKIVGTLVSPNKYHYTIPDSLYYLEFMIKEEDITIEKKKKKQ